MYEENENNFVKEVFIRVKGVIVEIKDAGSIFPKGVRQEGFKETKVGKIQVKAIVFS